MSKQWYVYILASRPNGVLYIGMTNDLVRRTQEHKREVVDGFTKKYHVHRLVYYEAYDDPEHAIRREKNMKAWQRSWKERIINDVNPNWNDLSNEL